MKIGNIANKLFYSNNFPTDHLNNYKNKLNSNNFVNFYDGINLNFSEITENVIIFSFYYLRTPKISPKIQLIKFFMIS